jgi:DNA-binding transcriptional regulator GbsR (MarR family)
MLKSCAADIQKETDTDPITKERVQNMLQFVESTSTWYEQISEIPTSTLTKLMALGAKITKLVKK